jgi:hypothetical protein
MWIEKYYMDYFEHLQLAWSHKDDENVLMVSSLCDTLIQLGQPRKDSIELIRKGIIGDWKSVMTDEQSQRFDAIVAEKTQHMEGLDQFWSPQ